jgi:type IV pilus assembly protein PilM
MALFSQQSESYLGVDIGAGGIKLVELRKTKGRPQLWTYGYVEEALDVHPLQHHEKSATELVGTATGPQAAMQASANSFRPDDPRVDRYAQLLKQLCKSAKVESKRVTASLPVSHVFHAIITLPVIHEKEIDEHVAAKVKKILPRPIEEMQIVHQRIPDDAIEQSQEKQYAGRYVKFLVTAAPIELVQFYTAIFQKAGLQLEELETEAFALERALVGRDPSTTMIVDIGAERTNFFIVDQGLPVTHRSIHLGGNTFDNQIQKYLGVEQSIATQIKHDMSHLDPSTVPYELFDDVIDPVLKEIEYSFDLYSHQTGNEQKRLEKIILSGGSAQFLPVANYLSEKYNIKTFIGDPWARVVYQQGLKPMLDELGPRMAVSIGLAMRNIV